MSLVFLKLTVCMIDKRDLGEKNYSVVFSSGLLWTHATNYVGEKLCCKHTPHTKNIKENVARSMNCGPSSLA